MDEEGNEGDRSDLDSATTQAEPVDESFDATQYPKSPTFDQTVSSIQEDAPNHMTCYWTGWWPTLHFDIDYSQSMDVCVEVNVWIDILGIWGIDGFEFQLFDESTMTDQEMESLIQTDSDKFKPYWVDLSSLTNILAAAYVAARLLAIVAEKGNIWAQALFGVSAAVFIGIWIMWMIEFCHAVIESGIVTVSASGSF